MRTGKPIVDMQDTTEDLSEKHTENNSVGKEAFDIREELLKTYSSKIIPEFKEPNLTEDEVNAQLKYIVLTEILRANPEFQRWDSYIVSMKLAEKRVSYRIGNIVFLILKILAVLWCLLALIVTFFTFSSQGWWVLIILGIGLLPIFIIQLLEVFFWYIIGIIPYEDIFPIYKGLIASLFKK